MKIRERENLFGNRNGENGSIAFKFDKNSLAESLQIIADKIKSLSVKYENNKFRINAMYVHIGNRYGTASLDWRRNLNLQEKKKFIDEEKQRELKYKQEYIREIKKEAKRLKLI